MASLKESLAADTGHYIPSPKPGVQYAPPVGIDLQPVRNPMLRCPIPPISVTPDSLRQFDIGCKVPQMRLLTPPNNITGSGLFIQNTNIVSNTSSGSSSGGTGTSTNLKAKQTSITTSVLNFNDIFQGSLLLAKSFQLLQVTVSSAARVEIYGTALAQINDLSRGLDEAFPAGTSQNIITDLAIDSAPLVWSWQNKIGANNDFPQTSLIYITVTNLSVASLTITVTIGYVPLES